MFLVASKKLVYVIYSELFVSHLTFKDIASHTVRFRAFTQLNHIITFRIPDLLIKHFYHSADLFCTVITLTVLSRMYSMFQSCLKHYKHFHCKWFPSVPFPPAMQLIRVCLCVCCPQGPLRNTCGHFWLMIWEQKTKAVIMLNRVIEKGSVSSQYNNQKGIILCGLTYVMCLVHTHHILRPQRRQVIHRPLYPWQHTHTHFVKVCSLLMRVWNN